LAARGTASGLNHVFVHVVIIVGHRK